MKRTCGFFIYDLERAKLLIGHSTDTKNMFSIPKGQQDENEVDKETAIRETYEETGLVYDELDIITEYELPEIIYRSKKKVLKSYLIIVKTLIDNEIRCLSNFIDKDGNEKPEMDYFKWVDLNEASTLLPKSQIALLPEIKENILATIGIVSVLDY